MARPPRIELVFPVLSRVRDLKILGEFFVTVFVRFLLTWLLLFASDDSSEAMVGSVVVVVLSSNITVLKVVLF